MEGSIGPPFLHRNNLMRRAILLLTSSLLVASCGTSDDDSSPAQVAGMGAGFSAQRSGATADSAVDVATAFLNAANANDQESLKRYLTKKAREKFDSDSGLSFESDPSRTFEVGSAVVTGSEARVPATLTSDGDDQTATFLMRVEDGGWHIHGFEASMGEASFTISFEGENDLFSAIGDEIASGMAEAFEEAATEWKAGGSAEDIARARSDWDALDQVSNRKHDSAWMVTVNGAGRPAHEVIEELLSNTTLALDVDGHASSLGESVRTKLDGVSIAEALDRVCEEVGLVPVVNESSYAWSDEPQSISFEAGPRTNPIAFVGPFAVEARVEENAPNSTGEMDVTMWAIGLSKAVGIANSEMGTFLDISEARGSNGSQLLKDPDTHYMGSPTVEDGLFVYSLGRDLVGLLKGVRRIDAIEGELVFALPSNVHQVRFERPGTKRSGDWKITCKTLGENSNFELESETYDTDSAEVRFAPDDASGNPLGVVYQGSSSWNNKVSADVNVGGAPASVALKVFESNEQRLSFVLEDLPLQQFSEQPERLTQLSFTGRAPIEVRFTEFSDLSNPDFPEADFEVVSTANKDVQSASVTFEYLDASGTVTKDFMHTLTGTMTFDGTPPLVAAGKSVTQTTTAFFMPDGTQSVRVRIDTLEFLDGSTWENE